MGMDGRTDSKLARLMTALASLTIFWGSAMTSGAQTRTGASSFQMHGRAGHKVAAKPELLGDSSSPLPPVNGWRLIGRPAGSQAAVDDPLSSELRFVPDLQGTYLAEGSTGSDPLRMVVSVGPPKTLSPVKLDGGGSGDITTDKPYAGPSGAGINVVLLDRTTLTFIDQNTGGVPATKTYLDGAIAKHGNNALFLIAGAGSIGGNLSDLAPELEQLGGTKDFEQLQSDTSLSFVGLPGLKAGQAYQVGGGGLTGYFEPDVNANYVFTQLDYVPFTMTPSTDVAVASMVRVGAAVFPSTPPPDQSYSFSGGFNLLVLNAASLQPIFQQSYPTLADTPQQSIAQQQALIAELKSYKGVPGVLMFLTSFGSAHNGNSVGAPDFAALAREIDVLGGSYEAVYNLNIGDTYSLACWTDAVTQAALGRDAGSQVDTAAGEKSGMLRGILQRGKQGNWYRPISTSTVAGPNIGDFDLYSILAQPASPFPPLPPGPYQSISQTVLCAKCNDFRAEYADLSVDVDALRLDLQSKADVDPINPQSPSCLSKPAPATDYCQTFMTLDDELGDVAQVRSLYGQLSDIYTASQSNVGLKLMGAVQRVNDALKPKPPSPVASIVETVIGSVLSVAGSALGPGKYAVQGAALGIISTLFNMSTGIANSVDGNSSTQDVNTEAGKLAEDAVAAFEQVRASQGLSFQIILEDGGKTAAMASKIKDTSSGFAIDSDRATSFLNALDQTAEISAYQSLLAIDYVIRIWNAEDSKSDSPGAYKYRDEIFNAPFSIFRDFKAESWYGSLSARLDSGNYARDFFTLTKAGNIAGEIGFPSYGQIGQTSLLDHLFDAVSAGGLGVTKRQFYRTWPFSKAYCSSPGYPLSEDPGSNCDFSTPQLPQ